MHVCLHVCRSPTPSLTGKHGDVSALTSTVAHGRNVSTYTHTHTYNIQMIWVPANRWLLRAAWILPWPISEPPSGSPTGLNTRLCNGCIVYVHTHAHTHARRQVYTRSLATHKHAYLISYIGPRLMWTWVRMRITMSYHVEWWASAGCDYHATADIVYLYALRALNHNGKRRGNAHC